MLKRRSEKRRERSGYDRDVAVVKVRETVKRLRVEISKLSTSSA